MPPLALILAQVSPAPEGLASFLEVVMYLVGIAAGIAGLALIVKQLREKKEELPNPLTVAPHVPFVSRPDFDKAIKEAHGRMNREKAERDAEVAAMKDATSALRDKVDREVDAMRELVATAHTSGEARAGRIHDRVDELGKQLAAMPALIVGLLRNAKDL